MGFDRMIHGTAAPLDLGSRNLPQAGKVHGLTQFFFVVDGGLGHSQHQHHAEPQHQTDYAPLFNRGRDAEGIGRTGRYAAFIQQIQDRRSHHKIRNFRIIVHNRLQHIIRHLGISIRHPQGKDIGAFHDLCGNSRHIADTQMVTYPLLQHAAGQDIGECLRHLLRRLGIISADRGMERICHFHRK